jgi:hypothetical protein
MPTSHASNERFFLAYQHQLVGEIGLAEDGYRALLKDDENHVQSLNNLGVICAGQGRLTEAEFYYAAATRLSPQSADFQLNIGNLLAAQGRLGEAVLHYRQALHLRPGDLDIRLLVGATLAAGVSPADAVVPLRQVLAARTESVQANLSLGGAYMELTKFDEALACFDSVLRCMPDHALGHFNRALALLSLGRYREGWREWEWRWRCRNFYTRSLTRPEQRWDGASLAGRTILLYAEQGHGDTLQFLRYVPHVRREAARVIIRCGRDLTRLVSRSGLADVVIGPDDPVPAFDLHAALMSLPGFFDTTTETVPDPVRALVPSPELVTAWRKRLTAPGIQQVGICWQGNPNHQNDGARSVSPERFVELAGVPGVQFVSLQKGATVPAALSADSGSNRVEQGGDWADFEELAAIVSQLDLVISVDTSVAHLAGTMGKPVWIALPYAADWRWMVDDDTSRWYPTSRLFRQPARGDWTSVFEHLRNALTELTQHGRG